MYKNKLSSGWGRWGPAAWCSSLAAHFSHCHPFHSHDSNLWLVIRCTDLDITEMHVCLQVYWRLRRHGSQLPVREGAAAWTRELITCPVRFPFDHISMWAITKAPCVFPLLSYLMDVGLPWWQDGVCLYITWGAQIYREPSCNSSALRKKICKSAGAPCW